MISLWTHSHPLQPTDPPVLPLSEEQPAAAADVEASRLLIRHVNLDKRKLLFLNRLFLHQIRHQEVLLWHRLSSTPTLLRHMDECMLN